MNSAKKKDTSLAHKADIENLALRTNDTTRIFAIISYPVSVNILT